MAVCPFCRKFITTNQRIFKFINTSDDTDALRAVLSGKANFITCPECNEKFYYEHLCGILNTAKKYAVMCIPNKNLNLLPNEKAAVFKILGIDDFKLRYVYEFINLIEKVRIFEYNLDDRAFELVKHKYIPSTHKSNSSKIILTNASGNSMEFTTFDDFDRPLSTNRVCIDAYFNEYSLLKKEIIAANRIQWLKIDTEWAKKLRSTL